MKNLNPQTYPKEANILPHGDQILINNLVLPHTMLRPVQESSIEFMEMTDSIREHGLLNSILVRPHPTREGKYEIVDGMWRFTVCKQLGMLDLPCIIKRNIESEEQYLALQIQANCVSFETKPFEFAKQMQRMLYLREEVGSPMTFAELARIVGKSARWVSTRLKLLELCEEAQQMVEAGSLGIGKAVAISKLNSHFHQKEFLKMVNTLDTRQMELAVGKFIVTKKSEILQERRGNRDTNNLVARIQSMDTLLIELDNMSSISELILQLGLTNAYEGAKITLEWVLNLHSQGREDRLEEVRHKLSLKDRRDIIGRQRYEELNMLRELKEKRAEQTRKKFYSD